MQNSSHKDEGSVTETAPEKPRKPRGFATMDPARRAEISRLGGLAAHEQGRAHQWTSEEAKAAGRKGGAAPHVRRGRYRGEKEPANAT